VVEVSPQRYRVELLADDGVVRSINRARPRRQAGRVLTRRVRGAAATRAKCRGGHRVSHRHDRKDRVRERSFGKRREEKKTEENDVFFQPADRHE